VKVTRIFWFIKRRRLDEALAEALQFAANYRLLAASHYCLGAVQMERQDYRAAIGPLGAAIRIQPHSWRYYFLRGNALAISGAYQLAIEDYTRALALSPGLPGLFGNRAECHLMLGDHQAAIDDATLEIENGAAYAEVWCHRGRARLQMKQFLEALDDLTGCLNRDPGYAAAYYYRARTYRALARDHEASVDNERAVELNPALETGEPTMQLADRNLLQPRVAGQPEGVNT
jgi:tetratricopeptide (TPR) repeat protein